MARPSCESEYEFTLLLGGVSEISIDLANVLFKAGCDDATISSRGGRGYLMFSRTAGSIEDAVRSAIRDVERAKLGARVLRVEYSSAARTTPSGCTFITAPDAY